MGNEYISINWVFHLKQKFQDWNWLCWALSLGWEFHFYIRLINAKKDQPCETVASLVSNSATVFVQDVKQNLILLATEHTASTSLFLLSKNTWRKDQGRVENVEAAFLDSKVARSKALFSA